MSQYLLFQSDLLICAAPAEEKLIYPVPYEINMFEHRKKNIVLFFFLFIFDKPCLVNIDHPS